MDEKVEMLSRGLLVHQWWDWYSNLWEDLIPHTRCEASPRDQEEERDGALLAQRFASSLQLAPRAQDGLGSLAGFLHIFRIHGMGEREFTQESKALVLRGK